MHIEGVLLDINILRVPDAFARKSELDIKLQLVRLRAGVGYILNKTWRAELIYHTEFTGDPKQYTGNIWRLNIKLTLPRKGIRHTQDIDIE